MSTPYTDSHYALVRPDGYDLNYSSEGLAEYVGGYARTPHGTVRVYSSRFGSRAFTALSLIHGGILFERRYERFYRPRYLVTLAARFAAEVTYDD